MFDDSEDDPSSQHLLKSSLRTPMTATPEKERTYSPSKTETNPPPEASTTSVVEESPIKASKLSDFASKYDSGKCKTYTFDIYKSPQKPKAFEKTKSRPTTRNRRIVKSKESVWIN